MARSWSRLPCRLSLGDSLIRRKRTFTCTTPLGSFLGISQCVLCAGAIPSLAAGVGTHLDPSLNLELPQHHVGSTVRALDEVCHCRLTQTSRTRHCTMTPAGTWCRRRTAEESESGHPSNHPNAGDPPAPDRHARPRSF